MVRLGDQYHQYEVVLLNGEPRQDADRYQATTTISPPLMKPDALKAVLLLSLLILCFFCSILPFFLRRLATSSTPEARRQRYALLFTILSVFGGGVFLATCLLDLLPDAVNDVNDALSQLNRTTTPDNYPMLYTLRQFPISEFMVCMGFFLVLFAEQLVMWMKEKGMFSSSSPSSSFDNDYLDEVGSAYVEINEEPSGDTSAAAPVGGGSRHNTTRSAKSDRSRSRSGPATRRSGTVSRRGELPGQLPTLTARDTEYILTASDSHQNVRRHNTACRMRHSSLSSGSASSFEAANDPIPADPVTEIAVISQSPVPPPDRTDGAHSDVANTSAAGEPAGHGGHDHDLHFDPGSHSTVRAVLLVAALSLHSIFEGLALGLAVDASQALQLFMALCIHKSLISFSLGLRMVQSALSTPAIFLSCLVFCLGAPIGGALGWCDSNRTRATGLVANPANHSAIGILLADLLSGATGEMISGCLTGVACGTFLYVTCFEILPHELNDGKERLIKMISLSAGFALIVILVMVLP